MAILSLILISTKNSTRIQNVMLFAQNAPLIHETAVMIGPSGGHLEKAALLLKK